MVMLMPNDIPELYDTAFCYSPEHDKNSPDTSTAAIRILEESFKNIVFRYDTIRPEERNDGSMVMHFSYTIIEGEVKDDDLDDFHTLLSQILHDILIVATTVYNDKEVKKTLFG